MFTLPVTTAALAGWPMLYGTAAMASLWLAMRLFAVWPSEFDVPGIWPALLAAALLAWTQALTWMPYGLPGLRGIVAMLLLATIDAVALLAIYSKAGEPLMVAFLAPQVPLAYLVARSAVARARRGDVPDWRPMFARLGRIANVLPRRRDNFASPARAQLWFEWRRHGRSLPALVAILLPFELALLFAAGRAQHVAQLILPALERGDWVVCARFIDSSLAYQGHAYGIDLDEMRRLQRFATGGLLPDLTILLDVPVEIGLGRKRHGAWNRFEDTQGVAFFERVRSGYLALAAEEPQRIRVIDGSGSVEESDARVRDLVMPLLPA